MNIGLLPAQHARMHPNRLAVIYQDQRLTWRDVNARINRLANAWLALGVRQGDKVATLLPNCLELLETYWAVAKIGAVVVPLSPLMRGSGLVTLLRDSDASLVLTDRAFAAHLDAVRDQLSIQPERCLLTDAAGVPGYQHCAALTAQASDAEPTGIDIRDDDPYDIMYSSGTTGLPKGIIHTHYIRAMYCLLLASAYRITPESVILHAGSLVFNGAMLTLMPAFLTGARYVLQSHFDPRELIEAVKREAVTHIKLVPSQIIPLLHEPDFDAKHLPSLQMIGSVGAPLHKEHKVELDRRLPGVFYELYGLTEGFITVLDKNDFATKGASVGAPLPFFEMRILDEQGGDLPPGQPGEIVGRGPFLMPGYYKRPDLTAHAIDAAGWLHSGDIGYADADGFLYLVDRKKDMIISGGINIYPRDIEEIVVRHPAVREVAVFGVPDDRWGETPLAAVILNEPGATTADDLREWVNARIEARYQKVSQIVILDEFPRSTAGKTLKRVMREPYWAGRATRI